jgi:hypothetical protein
MKDILPAYTEAGKELLRVALLAVIPLLIDMLNSGEVNWKALGIVALIAVLRAVDKLLHETGKITKNDNLTLGLTRF